VVVLGVRNPFVSLCTLVVSKSKPQSVNRLVYSSSQSNLLLKPAKLVVLTQNSLLLQRNRSNVLLIIYHKPITTLIQISIFAPTANSQLKKNYLVNSNVLFALMLSKNLLSASNARNGTVKNV